MFSCALPARDPVDPPAQHPGGGGGIWVKLQDLQLSQTQVKSASKLWSVARFGLENSSCLKPSWAGWAAVFGSQVWFGK